MCSMYSNHRRLVFIAVLLAGFATVACAQNDAKQGLDAAQNVSLIDLFHRGGWLMYVLLAMSVFGLAMVFYSAAALRLEQIVPKALRRDILGKISLGNWEDVETACRYKPCPLSEITLTALEYVKAVPVTDETLLKDIIEGEGTRQAVDIQAEPQFLLDVAVIAPMVGLLGTVFGMMQAFNVVALDLAKAKPMLLAAGVAEALITTAAGLVIGIPAMMFYAYFRRKASALVSHLESASSEILTAFLKTRRP